MNIRVTHDNGNHFLEVSLSNHKKTKIKRILVNEFEQDEKTNKTYLVNYAGGQWEIPKEKVNEMYKEIVLAYGRVINSTTKERKESGE